MVKQLPHNWGEIRRDWRVLTIHQRLETAAAYVLTFVIDVVILVALYRLIVSVVGTVILRTLNPLEHAARAERRRADGCGGHCIRLRVGPSNRDGDASGE